MTLQEIYGEAFADPVYCPGVGPQCARYEWVGNEVSHRRPDVVLDVGAGRGALEGYVQGFSYTPLDIDNYGEFDAWLPIDLTVPTIFPFDKHQKFVACLDVLEHLPEESIPTAMETLSKMGEWFAFTIANHSDMQNGYQLHLTQRDRGWWMPHIMQRFHVEREHSANRLMMFAGKMRI